jgi:hypothetical protein
MYLARRRHTNDGIFQATAFKGKPRGRSGLKAGTYFLALEVCKEIEAHLRKDRRPPPVAILSGGSHHHHNGGHSSTSNASGNQSPGGGATSKRLRDGSPRPASPSAPHSPTLGPVGGGGGGRAAERAAERLAASDSPTASPASLARRLLLKSSSRTASPLGRAVSSSSSSSSRPESPRPGEDAEPSPPSSPTSMLSKLSIGRRHRKKSRSSINNGSSSPQYSDDDVSSSDGDASSGWESGSDVDTGVQTSIPSRMKAAPGRSSRAASAGGMSASIAPGSMVTRGSRQWTEHRSNHWSGSNDDLTTSAAGSTAGSPPHEISGTDGDMLEGVDGVTNISFSPSPEPSPARLGDAIPAHVTKAWVFDQANQSSSNHHHNSVHKHELNHTYNSMSSSSIGSSSFAPVLATLAPLTPPPLESFSPPPYGDYTSMSPFPPPPSSGVSSGDGIKSEKEHAAAQLLQQSGFGPSISPLSPQSSPMTPMTPNSPAPPSSLNSLSINSSSTSLASPPLSTGTAAAPSPSPFGQGHLPASAFGLHAIAAQSASLAQATAALSNASLPPALQAQLLHQLQLENQQLMQSLAAAEGIFTIPIIPYHFVALLAWLLTLLLSMSVYVYRWSTSIIGITTCNSSRINSSCRISIIIWSIITIINRWSWH